MVEPMLLMQPLQLQRHYLGIIVVSHTTRSLVGKTDSRPDTLKMAALSLLVVIVDRLGQVEIVLNVVEMSVMLVQLVLNLMWVVQLMVIQSMNYRSGCASSENELYWNFDHTVRIWFVYGNWFVIAYDDTSSRIVCKLCDSFRTGTASPMNEYVRVAYGPIHWQMFYHNRCTDRHEHLCDSFGCVAVDLSDRCIPINRKKKETVSSFKWFLLKLMNIR